MYDNRISHAEAGRERSMVTAQRKTHRLDALHERAEEHALRVEVGGSVDADPVIRRDERPQKREERLKKAHVPTEKAWTPRWMK